MATTKYSCEECDSQFTIKYQEDHCEDSPRYCPFCGSYVFDENSSEDED